MPKKPIHDPDKTRKALQTPPRGRIRAAWSVLMGQNVTPVQIRSEWLSYQIAFDGIFDKLSTALARLAKRDQREIQKKMELLANEPVNQGHPIQPGGSDAKAQLRARVFGTRFPSQPNGPVQEGAE